MLGIDPHAKFQPFETKLEPGSGLLLYTDGIVENERDYIRGTELLLQAFRTEYQCVSENAAQAIQERVLSGRSPADDAAIMFIGVTQLAQPGAPRQYQWQFDARDEHSSRRIKRAVLWHLGKDGPGLSDLSAAEIVVGELISNVARHTPGHAEMALEMQNGTATVQVCDRGDPFVLTRTVPDLFSESGRGLILIRALARDVSIERTEGGNCVRAILP